MQMLLRRTKLKYKKGRFKTHIKDIRINRTSSNCICVHKHFNSSNHDALKYFTFNIFNTDVKNFYVRLTIETQLCHLFKKLDVVLLNINIPSLYYYTNVNLFSKQK